MYYYNVACIDKMNHDQYRQTGDQYFKRREKAPHPEVKCFTKQGKVIVLEDPKAKLSVIKRKINNLHIRCKLMDERCEDS